MPSITRCGRLREDEAILDRAGLAFVGVADDVFFRARLLADQLPFRFGGKSRAAQAAKARGFQQREGGIPIARLHQAPDDGVTLARRGVWIGGAGDAAARGGGFGQRALRNHVANHFFDLRFGQPRVDAVVDGDGRGLIAAAEARDAAHDHIGAAQILKPLFEARAKTVGAAKVAGHVLADADVRLGRRRETKMRIKAGDSVQAIEGNVNLLRRDSSILQQAGNRTGVGSPATSRRSTWTLPDRGSFIPAAESISVIDFGDPSGYSRDSWASPSAAPKTIRMAQRDASSDAHVRRGDEWAAEENKRRCRTYGAGRDDGLVSQPCGLG